MLYHVEQDKTLRIFLPTVDRRKVFDKAHSSVYGAHLQEAKIHGQLSKHYWWPQIHADITTWCRECEVCASHTTGLDTKPPLNQRSKMGNQYAIVFVDYLSMWPKVFATKDQSSLTIARLLIEVGMVCQESYYLIEGYPFFQS